MSRKLSPEVATWLRLGRIISKMGPRLAAHLQQSGLTPAQFDILAHLLAAPGILQQELADQQMVTKGNIVGLLDRMEQAGLLERRPHPEDGRAHLVYLTKRGELLASRVIPEHEAHVADCMSVLAPADLRMLHRLLSTLDRALGPY